MIFLLHFYKPYARFRHCVGAASRWPVGSDATWFKPATAAGLTWRVARTWDEKDLDFAERLRGLHRNLARYCPICSGEAAYRRGVRVGRSPTEPGRCSVRVSEQAAICLRCPLRDCVGTESPRCPISIERRRRRSAYDKRRSEAAKNRKALESSHSRRPADDQPPEWRPLERDQSTTPLTFEGEHETQH